MSGNLDFGIPALYSGKKRLVDDDKELRDFQKNADVVLITQGFDDHAHMPTLKKLKSLRPDISYVVPSSAVKILNKCGVGNDKLIVMAPRQKQLLSKDVELIATTGALLGPPWQKRENGYIIRQSSSSSSSTTFPSVYIEPHCMFDERELVNYVSDIVITPVIGQSLAAFDLVAGGKKALKLASLLQGI